MEERKTKLLIIGSGPAGYTAGIYASRANLQPLIYEGNQPGGQLTQTTEIENFPGYPEGVQGPEMMQDLRRQAERFGAEVISQTIEKVDFHQRPFVCEDDHGHKVIADAVIICTGAKAKYLGLEDEQKYNGLGVSACATCDGFFYRKKTVAVVGGGDTACEEATYLAGLCAKVYMIVRKPYLRASDVMRRRVEENPKIEILYEHNAIGLYGDDKLAGAHLVRRKGEADETTYDLPIDGFFLAIGHKPNTDVFAKWIERDDTGYIITRGASPCTNVPGVFAAGDCADPTYRQAIVAAGSGCKAALEAERFLNQ